MYFLFNIFKKKLDKKCLGLFIVVDINFQNTDKAKVSNGYGDHRKYNTDNK